MNKLSICEKCNTPREHEVELFGVLRVVPVMCECRKQAYAKEEAERERRERARRVKALRAEGMPDLEYASKTFGKDDGTRPEITKICKSYVENFEEILKSNAGLLFYGGVGTGKTFYALCIANALLDKNFSVLATNFPRLLSEARANGFGGGGKTFAERLAKYDLLIIDDLGVERGTDYALEQMFELIDARYRSGKPLIITTNLAPKELTNPESVAYERIYDRILENCLPVKITGNSRRADVAEAKRAKWKEVLGVCG